MPPRDIFAQLSLWIVNFHLKSYIFAIILYCILLGWIRIRISNTDPVPNSDPQHWAASLLLKLHLFFFLFFIWYFLYYIFFFDGEGDGIASLPLMYVATC